ncbi:MAG: hypothetical protein HDS78_04625 [Bacteroidales bacterium]|nr:hypothetical protein [Bacteroidales bacterium]MBD5218830.1 hypothetical protein [Bacteroidales bacterium]
MCKELRKVLYKIRPYEQYPADYREAHPEELKDFEKRRGYFHRWVDDVDFSGDVPVTKPLAIIEDADTGKVELINYFCINFTEDWL